MSFETAVAAIVLRALLPMVKNTYIGLSCIDEVILDSARGIGLTWRQTLIHIRFPNAYPAIFAGVKFAAIIASSLAILTGMVVGVGDLGKLINVGLATFNTNITLAGAIPAMFIAIALDFSLSRIEKRLKD